MSYNLLLIRTSGEVEKIAVSKEIELELLQSLVGGYIECVPTMFPHIEMLVNEEGKLDGMKYNKVATDISRVSEYDMIVGDAVLCKVCGDHLVGLSKTEAEEIIRRLE